MGLENKIAEYLNEGKNDRGQYDLTTASIEERKELDITMPACCASCMKARPGTQWRCNHPKILDYFLSKIVYTAPDLLCKYYVG